MAIIPFRRSVVNVGLAALTIGALAVVTLTAPQAKAAPPAVPTATPVAPRTNAEGGPADTALVETWVLTESSDGTVLFYDRTAHQIRQMDPTTRIISPVAGTGTVSTARTVDVTNPAIDVALPEIDGLWTDSAGDIFAWMCGGINCIADHDLYRLAKSDSRWHLAVSDPDPFSPGAIYNWEYQGFAVAPDGDVLAVDTIDHVLRKFASGADPAGRGTVIAGTAGRAGQSGDGGPAISATIDPSGAASVSPSGDIYFADAGGRAVRHIGPDGTVSTVANPVVPNTKLIVGWTVRGLTSSPDGATVYVEGGDGSVDEQVLALSDDGATSTTVAGSQRCDSASQGCVGPSIALATEKGAPVVVSAAGSIDSWPLDGSDPQRYHRFAGILNDALGVRSPDGTRLDQAYLSIRGMAVSSEGVVALAGFDGIHTLTGLTPDSVISTLAPGLIAGQMSYGADGTLYATVQDPTPHIVAISPTGSVTTVLGGGSGALTAGAVATDVRLSYSVTFGVDPSSGVLVFAEFTDGGGHLWQLAPGGSQISAFGDPAIMPTGQSKVLAVAGDHSVLAEVNGLLRRFQPDGTSSVVCYSTCPDDGVRQLPDGLIVGTSQSGWMALGRDGTAELLGGSYGTVTPDGRLLTAVTGSSAAGLLAETPRVASPNSENVPAVQVTASSSSALTVTVTHAVAGQQVSVYTSKQDADGAWTRPLNNGSSVVSGTTTTLTLRSLFTTWPAPARTVKPPTYRVSVIVGNPGDATHDEIDNAPLTYTVAPTLDSLAPGRPALTLGGGSTTVSLTVGRPNDSDLDRVIVCKSDGVAAAPDPRTCDVVGVSTFVGTASSDTQYLTVDPRRTTTFTAFAVDDSGNVSPAVSVTRSSAVLIPGNAISNVYLVAGTNEERVFWTGGWAAHVRYAAGSTPPATMNDGAESTGQYEDGGAYPERADSTGYEADVPVSDAATVSVSIFMWADDDLGSYRRTTLTIAAGTTSDSTSISATARVAKGVRPTVHAQVTRKSPIGTQPALANHSVQLYRRNVGNTAWTLAATGKTSSDGSATFIPSAPVVSTQYQVRGTGADAGVTSTIVTTQVVAPRPVKRARTISIKVASHVKHRHVVTMSGLLAPRHTAVVYAQEYIKHKWVTVASTRTKSSGAYAIRYSPKKAGREKLRVIVAGNAAYVATHSVTRTLAVT